MVDPLRRLRAAVAAALDRPLAAGAGARLLVACSGGPDSTALLDVLVALAPARGLGLHVAAVDHGLRPAAAGEAAAVAALERYEDRMARALAVVLDILDPDVVVLGGGISRIERLYASVPRLWQQWAFSDRVFTQLKPPVHGDASGVRGAAWLWGPGEA